MLERCPTCGKTIGTLMETDPNRPGLLDLLSDRASHAQRVMITGLLCLLAVLAIVATELILR
jgi:hypothetical protein